MHSIALHSLKSTNRHHQHLSHNFILERQRSIDRRFGFRSALRRSTRLHQIDWTSATISARDEIVRSCQRRSILEEIFGYGGEVGDGAVASDSAVDFALSRKVGRR